MNFLLKIIRRTFLVLVFFVFQPVLKAQFTLELTFTPSYLPVSTVIVKGLNEGNSITVKSESFGDSAQINSNAIAEIQDFFNKYLIVVDTNKSVLEAHVKGSYLQDGKIRMIEFNAPKKGDKSHVLLQRLWSIMYAVLEDQNTINYLERVEQQFDFGLGVKTLNEDPLTYKLYGKITAHKSEAFYAFLQSIPADREVIIDMINFQSMGRVFYPSINALAERNPNITWINCNRKTWVHLMNSRVPHDRVIRKDK